MNPALQYQIIDPSTGKFVQLDGGQDSQNALLINILQQQIETNSYLRAMLEGRTPTDSGTQIRADALSDTTLFQIG